MEHDQSLQAPEVDDGARHPLFRGTGALFDECITVPTPGLGDGSVHCSICIPRREENSDTEPLPLILVAEGGGYILGEPNDGEKYDRMLSDRLHAVVIDVDYAKSPRYPFPHALLQLYEVLRWSLRQGTDGLRGHLPSVKINPNMVAVMGNSAGGSLVAALALLLSANTGLCARFHTDLETDMAGENDSITATFSLAAQIMLYPGVGVGIPYRTRYQVAPAEVQEKSLPIWAAELMEECYLPPGIDKDQVFVSPVRLQELPAETIAALGRRLPPALLLLAGADCLKFEAKSYADTLSDAGVETLVREFPGCIHGYSHYKEDNKDYQAYAVEETWDTVCTFLGKQFLNRS